MVIAKIYVDGVSARIIELRKVPQGIIGATIEVTYSAEWSQLTKTAVFSGSVTKDVLGVGNTITIPAEVVAKPGHRLRVGFYGVADNTLTIPTLWADLGNIQAATDPSGDTSTNPLLPVWAQIQKEVEELKQIGGSVGPQGPQGPKGEAGKTPVKGVDYWTPEDKKEIVEEFGAISYNKQSLTPEQQTQARENIGAASDEDIDKIKSGLDCVTSRTTALVPVKFEVIPCGMISNAGKISTNNASKYCISSNVPVTPGETLYITAVEHYGNAYYAFYDNDNNPVLVRHDNSASSTATPIFDEEVVVPTAAATVVIAFFGTVTGSIKRMVPDVGMRLQPWKGRVWAVVGDSLTERDPDIAMTYHDYIAEATGISVVNLGYSGSGYAKTGAGQAFHLRINKVPANSDVVTIFGSFNDLSSELDLGTPSDTGTETICGCINTTIDNLIAVMPAVCLGIVTPTPWKSGNPADPNNAQTKYADALVEICKNRSIPCLDLYRCSNLRPWTEEGRAACYSKDDGAGCHPDETGHKLIASRFKAFLESLIM